MTNVTVGEVDWNIELPGQGGSRESDFMNLEEGENDVRVLAKPQQKYVHWVVDEMGKKRKVDCAIKDCPVCKRGQDGDRAKASWLVKVLNRKDNKVKLLEIGPQIFGGIQKLVDSKKWGPVSEYDITILRGAPGTKPLYTVVPSPHSPLTAEEKQAFAAFNERVDISRFVTPPAPAVVAEKLGWTMDSSSKPVSNDFKSGNGSATKTTKKPEISFDFDQ